MGGIASRTFGLNMEVCAHCGGRMHFVAALTDPASIKAYLDGVGLPSVIPEITARLHKKILPFSGKQAYERPYVDRNEAMR